MFGEPEMGAWECEQCGEIVVLEHDPREIRWKYCPRCGGKITQFVVEVV